MPAGRPLKFESVEALQTAIDKYFDSIKEPVVLGDNVYFEPATITGLALALDTTRETLCNYEDRPEFSDTVKRAKLRVEHYAEKQLYLGRSASGPIFALKNFGWRDTQDFNHGGQADNPIEIANSKDIARRIAFLLAGATKP
jgi:hypothetical protein